MHACACINVKENICTGGRAASPSSAVLQCADEAWVDEM